MKVVSGIAMGDFLVHFDQLINKIILLFLGTLTAALLKRKFGAC